MPLHPIDQQQKDFLDRLSKRLDDLQVGCQRDEKLGQFPVTVSERRYLLAMNTVDSWRVLLFCGLPLVVISEPVNRFPSKD